MWKFILLIVYLLLSKSFEKGKFTKKYEKYENYKADMPRKKTFDSSVQRKKAQKQASKRDLGEFLGDLEKSLYRKSKDQEGKDPSTYIFEKSRKKKSEENKAYSMDPDYLEAEVLHAQRFKEYELSIYGADEENPIFDYDYAAINNVDEDLELEIFENSKRSLDLKEAIIMKEILDKPLALRKN